MKKIFPIFFLGLILQQTFCLTTIQTQNERTEEKETQWYADTEFEYPYGLAYFAISGSDVNCGPGPASCDVEGCLCGSIFGMFVPTEGVYYNIKTKDYTKHFFGTSQTIGLRHYALNGPWNLGLTGEASLDLCVGSDGFSPGLKIAGHLMAGYFSSQIMAGYAMGCIDRTFYIAPEIILKYRCWDDYNIIAACAWGKEVKRFSAGIRGRL